MSEKQTQFGFELRYDGWAEKLEREFAIVLTPYLDKSFAQSKCREISARLAMLAAKRAREASALLDETPMVKCRGCNASIVAQDSVCLCESCGKTFRTSGSDG